MDDKPKWCGREKCGSDCSKWEFCMSPDEDYHEHYHYRPGEWPKWYKPKEEETVDG